MECRENAFHSLNFTLNFTHKTILLLGYLRERLWISRLAANGSAARIPPAPVSVGRRNIFQPAKGKGIGHLLRRQVGRSCKNSYLSRWLRRHLGGPSARTERV